MKLYISLAYVTALLSSCGPASTSTPKDSTSTATVIDSATASGATDDLVATHRFSVKGDFDGDGREETLTEHFLYKDSQQEARKSWVADSFDIISKEI